MAVSPVRIHRLSHRITPDPRRVITRFFGADETRSRRRIERVLGADDAEVDRLLQMLEMSYRAKHPDIEEIWLANYERVAAFVPKDARLDRRRQMLIGAYFTMEYAIEAAALFNPSIIPAIDQSQAAEGSTRFLMSMRATGEGHLSSVVFRTGEITRHNHIVMDDAGLVCRPSQPAPNAEFDTEPFRHALEDLDALGPVEQTVLERMGGAFTPQELREALESVRETSPSYSAWKSARENMLTLAGSNYIIHIPPETPVPEVVIFPVSERESHGIEDLRLVRFTEDDGGMCIYGTYTAYNGMTGFPSLLMTRDFNLIESHSMAGPYAKNKGMALFPRRINGKYVMSGRPDGESLYIMESDTPLVWNNARAAQRPKYWWEFSVIGNCGSPVETPEGWLMLTHGVGPMRQYSIGAALLDLDDPSRLIARSKEPLIIPTDSGGPGYVPNVVYSCGSMIHDGVLVIPYAVNDFATTFASVALDELIADLTRE